MSILNVSQSRVKQFRRCQKQYSFRYDYPVLYGGKAKQEMVPLRKKLPLYRGSWMHALQEALHHQWAGATPFEFVFGEGRQAIKAEVETWQDVQELLTQAFESMFDEEKEDLGDLAFDTERMFKRYLKFWDEDQETYSVAELPDGSPAIEFLVESPLTKFGLKDVAFKGKIDLLVEDDEYGGLWIWDGKWMKNIPAPDERMMSPQAPLYVWGLREKYGLDVRGFVYNYARSKPPSIPHVLKNGTLSIAKKIDTDQRTFLQAIKDTHGKNWKRYIPYYKPKLLDLKGRERFWFDRARIPVDDDLILRAVREYVATVRDIQTREKRREYVPRSYFYNCKFGCDYHGICVAEYQGLEIEPMVEAQYQMVGERYEEEDLLSG
jgi:PD-(D/E)XK nuclease superfamily